jgi:D-alanyl-D-alanine carboxypeptidase/D-alanyl-D-alanine-endopeptidase (penicillin-binding protein 4)
VTQALQRSGVPASHLGLCVQPVDEAAAGGGPAWNADQPFLLASTAKVVTSLAALDLLGDAHRWRVRASSDVAPVDGRLAGDLLIDGDGLGLTPEDLKRWFEQLQARGLRRIDGRIVLRRFTVLQEAGPAQAAATAAERAAARPAPPVLATPTTPADPTLSVRVAPARGKLARVQVQPALPGVRVVNDLQMRPGADCGAYARWQAEPGARTQLVVSGLWDAGCGAREVATLRPPAGWRPPPALPAALPLPAAPSAAAMVAALWAEAGGQLAGEVVELPERPGAAAARAPRPAWRSEFALTLPTLVREINKTSNNLAARKLLAELAPAGRPEAARQRLAQWLQRQGLGEDDIRIELGSGQSRNERGKPRALVQLLRQGWRGAHARPFVDSLPVAGVDGTLTQRLRRGAATGHAFLKTGTLSDTRALAGYVQARSGKVYAVAAIVNHPQAAKATPALDALIEWLAGNG